ncbi:MAG: AAA family ATPase [Acidiferrobacterales bacterium]
MIQSLQHSEIYDHEVRRFAVIETHISWVLLTGPYAYKIKKPVDLGFLDFSTLDKRRFYCHEELRLNRRLAPRHYVDVIAITGTPQAPALNGEGPVIEYAVKMVQFPQEAQLDRVAARGALEKHHIDQLAAKLVAFHSNIEIAAPDSVYGNPERIQRVVLENFERVLSDLRNKTDINQLQKLKSWAEQEYSKQQDYLSIRKQNGFIRECHGDMHLRNMALLDDELLIFDCIEFSEDLRWIDVVSEAAFLMMDLDDRGHPELARRFLNAYVEHTGDYEGLKVLRYYLTYRAMVRAMVDNIRAHQSRIGGQEKHKVMDECRSYIALAEQYTRVEQPTLFIMHGFSGSGKTTVAQALLESEFVVRVRSDIERKRLHGLAPDARTRAEVGSKLYTADATQRTYARLADLAGGLLESGFTVMVDAAFLKQVQRDMFRVLAERVKVSFIILDCQTSDEILLQRVLNRERKSRDASEANAAVLTHQLATHEPLSDREKDCTVMIDTTRGLDKAQVAAVLRGHREAGNR